MQPVVYPLHALAWSEEALRLCDLVLVVRELQVYPARVYVDLTDRCRTTATPSARCRDAACDHDGRMQRRKVALT